MRGLLVAGLVMGSLGACSTTSSNSGGDNCAVGTLGCPCTAGGACDPGLLCDQALVLCVSTDSGGSAGVGQGGASAGNAGAGSGGMGAAGSGATAGVAGAGGMMSAGGSSGSTGVGGSGVGGSSGGAAGSAGVGGAAGMSTGGTGGSACMPMEDWEACGSWICGSVSDGCTGNYTCGDCGTVASAHCREGRCCNRWTEYDNGAACNGVRPYYITCTDDSDQPPEPSCIYYGHHISTPGYGRAFCCATET